MGTSNGNTASCDGITPSELPPVDKSFSTFSVDDYCIPVWNKVLERYEQLSLDCVFGQGGAAVISDWCFIDENGNEVFGVIKCNADSSFTFHGQDGTVNENISLSDYAPCSEVGGTSAEVTPPKPTFTGGCYPDDHEFAGQEIWRACVVDEGQFCVTEYRLDPVTSKLVLVGDGTVSIDQGSWTDKSDNKLTCDTEELCLEFGAGPVDLAAVEAAIAAKGFSWDNGDPVAGVASDNAHIVQLHAQPLRCTQKKQDGTVVLFDGEEGLCAVEVTDEGGNVAGSMNGTSMGHNLSGTYENPVEFNHSYTVNAGADGPACLQVTVVLMRKYDADGAVVSLSAK